MDNGVYRARTFTSEYLQTFESNNFSDGEITYRSAKLYWEYSKGLEDLYFQKVDKYIYDINFWKFEEVEAELTNNFESVKVSEPSLTVPEDIMIYD